MEPNELDLIHRTQAGDTEAFSKLMEIHDRTVWHVIYHMLGNQQDTQDLYQDTFLRAFNNIHTFRFNSSFKTWLVRISINLCVNYRKRKKLVQWISIFDKEDRADIQTQWMDMKIPDPEKRMEQAQIREQIDLAMKKLSNRERAVFVLKQIEGYKIKEIAQVLNCAEGTVKNYLFRATQKLKTSLTPIKT